MAYATIEDLQTELRLLDGRLTIGDDRESASITYDEAQYYLDGAHSQIKARFNLPDSLSSGDIYTMARRWEALKAARDIYLSFRGAGTEGLSDYLEQVNKILKEYEDAIRRLASVSPSVASDSRTDPDYSIWRLNPDVFPEIDSED